MQVEPYKSYLQLDKTLKGLCISRRLREAVGLLCATVVQVEPRTCDLLLQECIFRKEYKKGRRIHALMVVVGYDPSEYLKTKLLILYVKSGDLGTTHVLFDNLLEKSLVSWNAMILGSLSDGHRVIDKSLNRNVVMWTALISGYGQHGKVVEVLESFHRMKTVGFKPNYVTFLSVLSACSHGGLLDEGWAYFSSMTKDYGI
ncbi:pentatricopeptide repeat-containing protein [Quercus suber]|uniref:Pentatricopeptide repeat-containing protein n=1 Tax=Quercus suber TaxID=58331 RepID=A0AAW0LWG0_QUESU